MQLVKRSNSSCDEEEYDVCSVLCFFYNLIISFLEERDQPPLPTCDHF